MVPDEPSLAPAIITPDDGSHDGDDGRSSVPVSWMEIVTRCGGRVVVDADVDALARRLEVLDRR